VVIDRAACQASPSLAAVFNNALLGNTLAMALSFTNEEDLPYAPICPTMVAEGLAPGRPWHGNEKDRVKLSVAPSVIDALTSLHYGATPGGLLRLANHALAGSADLGGATLDDINSAVAAINDAFTGGAFVLSCTEQESRVNLQIEFDADQLEYLGSLLNIAPPGATQAGPSDLRVRLKEYGGVGAVIDRATIDHFSYYDNVYLFGETLSSESLSQLFNQCDSAGPHIPRHGRACGSIPIPDRARYTYIVVTLYGSDDQGKAVRVASRRLYFF
jgi:hypothetical protein